MELWQLPGPAAFVHALDDAITDGRNVIVASSIIEQALLVCMVDQCNGWGLPVEHCVASGQLPIDDVFDALCLDERIPAKRTIAALIARMPHRCRVIVSDLRPESLSAWMDFAVEYESACRAVSAFDRTQFVVMVAGAPKSALPRKAPALEVLVWDGWVGESDVLGYIAWCWRRRGVAIDSTAKLGARIITRLAMWDFSLVDRLMALPTTTLIEPGAWFEAIADDNADVFQRCWEGGGVGRFDGEDLVHSLVLAAEGDAKGELAMRLWAAQASELLPLLELRRRKLVDRMKSIPGMPIRMQLDGEVISDLDDVEIGGLTRLADAYRFPRPVVEEAKRLRWLRNRLAHLQPVTLDEAIVVLEPRG